MPLSVRNQFPGTVREIKLGVAMAEVIVKVGENQIVSQLPKMPSRISG
ncbi:MAG TPA: TOBE domain-containing protein [Candidatus Bathyarchaeia archaeon]|nr:TOBE domain-containing protein [Candidatus Bathyarchaeia archaeon]